MVIGKDYPDDEAIFSFSLRAKQKTFINEICILEQPTPSEVTLIDDSYVPETNGIACSSKNQLAIYSSKVLHPDGSPISGLRLWTTSNKNNPIPISDIATTGILYCILEFEHQKIVKKMIVF